MQRLRRYLKVQCGGGGGHIRGKGGGSSWSGGGSSLNHLEKAALEAPLAAIAKVSKYS